MVERGQHPRFALKTRQALGVVYESCRQHFDGDVASQFAVGCPIDLSHATRAQGGTDFVSSQLGAALERPAHESSVMFHFKAWLP